MPRLMVSLRDDGGRIRSSVCELPPGFAGAGAVTIHFGDWQPRTFQIHSAPIPMDRRQSERRSATDIKVT